MAKVTLIKGDVTEYLHSQKFHAILSDPPYELNFMGNRWDSSGVAFRAETWKKIRENLYPGAFGFAFSSSKLDHRKRVAIEEAGFVLHPTVWQWVVGNRMPKATNLKGEDGVATGYAYGQQTLSNAAEPVICFQNPYTRNGAISDIGQYGSGALWIDGGRIGGSAKKWSRPNGGFWKTNNDQEAVLIDNELGRHPKNLILQHLPDCVCIGEKDETYLMNTFDNGAKPFGDAVGEKYSSKVHKTVVLVWECVDGCPIKRMNDEYGVKKSGLMTSAHKINSEWGYKGGYREKPTLRDTYAGEGYVSRFYYQTHWGYDVFEKLALSEPVRYTPKISQKEKNAGCKHNPHPTVKPLEIDRYLATLLLPHPKYAPRRLYVPFCGSASEIIGAMLAGWEEIVGVDLDVNDEYLPVAQARINFWQEVIDKYGGLNSREILRLTQKAERTTQKTEQASLL